MIKISYMIVLIFILTGCKVSSTSSDVPEVKNAQLCKDPRPMMCTMDYRPVCGLHNDNTVKTYSNGCSACSNPEVRSYVPEACPQ